ncbi:hypothetical protein SARC_06036 [Sphaeroforma arctica JP610]|uniref:Uncharacterized protein n=1 Tax=Sphaeroforma arctica JP610 TaxID=667725 RepID=A0A0L0FYF4_9EUKA|nr:hypothetical protein SARC_06036 [Sphaeroforma arctica JP610]KNC81649.1 hypothetical protein SARC_06036 [Sphaeroforma arctica JP610]|eukprot:XP_014155551.1 hypothetical protein SARC_06036 [Sphaeroforma arctica JP610]
MGDRLQFLHQCREELGKFAPFVAYEPTDKNMKRLKLNTKHFFSLRGGFNEDAKTESAQQAINKLNSLKMFFDQFPSMRVPTTQLGKPESKRMKSEPADKGAGTAAFTKASDQITQQPLQLLVFDITNQEFEQFFPRWDTNEIPLEPFVLEASSSIGQLQSQLMADRAPSVQDEPIEINIHTISKRLQSGLFCTTTTPLGGLTEIRKSNQNGIVCLPIRSKRPQMVTFRHRELDFQQVCKYFDSHTCGGVVLLTGMAGVGKTVFCARYLWELFERERNGNAAAYRVTLWLDCSGLTTRTECETAFAGFASPAYLELQTPDDASNAQIIEHILYKWFFANKGQWLIVVDNVNAIGAEHIFDLLHPISSSGSVLVSSRWNEISLNGNGKDLKLKLDVVALDSAVEFLVTRSGMSEQAAQTQLSDIEGVAEKLGRLPQALDIVGERLRGSVQTFSDFNKSLQHTGSLKSVLSSLSPTGAQSLLSTFRQIAYSIPEGPSTELLNIIAYLPSIHIPIAIFTGFEHARHDFPKQVKVAFPNTELYRALEGQPQAIHSIIAPLLNSAVVNKLTEATGVLGMHPVVQEILRELMKPEECVKYRSAAVELLYSALCVERNDDDSMYSLGIDALIPHVWDVLSNSSSVQVSVSAGAPPTLE